MTRLPPMQPREVISVLLRAGYVVDRQTGSHVILYKEGALPVSVPSHSRDLKKGTLQHIVRSAGLTPEEFLKFR